MSTQNVKSSIQRIMSLGLTITGAFAFLAPLLTRIVMGKAFYYTGHGKLQNFDRTVSFFTDLGIPFPALNAGFVSTIEYVGGMCLIVGLGTRLFSFLLSGSMVVALLTADKHSFIDKFPADITDVVPFMYLVLLVWLVLYGPGPVSLDRILSRWFRRAEQPESIARESSASTIPATATR
jgi:putative oxidoreductase